MQQTHICMLQDMVVGKQYQTPVCVLSKCSEISTCELVSFNWPDIILESPFRCFSLVQEEFEDTKGVIRSRKPKKDRQHNGQKKKYKKDKQRSTKHTHKTKDRVTRTPLKQATWLSQKRIFFLVMWNCRIFYFLVVFWSCNYYIIEWFWLFNIANNYHIIWKHVNPVSNWIGMKY